MTFVQTEDEFRAAIETSAVIELDADIYLNSTISIGSSITVNGNGFKVDGQGRVPCFYVNYNSNVEMNELTVTNGAASTSSTGIYNVRSLCSSRLTDQLHKTYKQCVSFKTFPVLTKPCSMFLSGGAGKRHIRVQCRHHHAE